MTKGLEVVVAGVAGVAAATGVGLTGAGVGVGWAGVDVVGREDAGAGGCETAGGSGENAATPMAGACCNA